MLIQRQPAFGNLLETITGGISELFQPKGGQTIVVPGTPVPLSMATVGVLGAALLTVIILRKKRII